MARNPGGRLRAIYLFTPTTKAYRIREGLRHLRKSRILFVCLDIGP